MMNIVRKALWPFDQISHDDVQGLPEHLKQSARMRNRWHLGELRPFIQNWCIVLSFITLGCFFTAGSLMQLVFVLAWLVAFSALGFLVWLYSQRPH
jgi:hypothetical protein